MINTKYNPEKYKTQEELTQLLAALHQGGAWAYWWTDTGRESIWWEVGQPAPIPQAWKNVYFGIHPTGERGGQYTRARIDTIAAINCLFAEFDAKDFENSKGEALTHIMRLDRLPSVVIDSGGGYHAYWLLRQPFELATDQDRKRAQAIQAAWVKYTGGDQDAKDLARVLRVPGSFNHKYTPARPVAFVWTDFELLHELNELESISRPAEAPRAAQAGNNGRSSTDPGDYWLKQAVLRARAGSRNDSGLWLAAQLRDSGLGQGEAESIMLAYANQAPAGDHPYTESEALASLRSAYTRPPREPATLSGYRGNGSSPGNVDLSAAPETDSRSGYKLDDIGNGERMANRHGHKIRYVKEWGWLIWNGKYWQPDRGEVARMAKETARSIYHDAANATDDEIARSLAKYASASASNYKRAAMIESCASEPGIAAQPIDFDNDPWLLNCQNGILDLRTGELRPHDPRALMTKVTNAGYDPMAPCPIWLAFLDRIFSGDKAMIDFLQRAAGYSLTGNTGEQCLFFPYGIGANGKSTFNGALQAALGDYAIKTPTDTLMLKHGDVTATNDLARLAGARAVFAAELSEGKRLNESLIKDLTGGDMIAARYLHKEFFEFTPIFKLWLYGNHKPIIRGTDEGIWRRIKLIPFTVTIPEAERDQNMPEKLRAELPGILAWAVRGCLEWQRQGLNIPAEVKAATDDFRAEQDTLAAFLGDCCVINPLVSVTSGDLYAEYKTWAAENGLDPMSKISLSRRLSERGYSTNGREPGTGRAIYTRLGLLEKKM